MVFYCVADSDHFIGLAGLVNSLRTVGHDETVFVLDCGLTGWQRGLLARTPGIRLERDTVGRHPMLSKTVLPLRYPAELMVVVDVDVIATRRLDGLFGRGLLLFPDESRDRFEPEWSELGFGAPVRHPYLASGQMVLPREGGLELLRVWSEAMGRLASRPDLLASPAFRYPDMDALNALVGTAIPLDSFAVAAVDAVAYPPFADISTAYLLHHFMAKPWNGFVPPNAYSRALASLLSGGPIRVPRWRVPLRVQDKLPGYAGRGYVSARLKVRAAR